MSITPSYAAVSPSHLRPLIEVLQAGAADAEAQKLAGDLLTQATQRRLGQKPRYRMRKELMLCSWAQCRSMGTASEDAKQAVADMYGVTADAVEKLISRNPAFVAQLKIEMNFD